MLHSEIDDTSLDTINSILNDIFRLGYFFEILIFCLRSVQFKVANISTNHVISVPLSIGTGEKDISMLRLRVSIRTIEEVKTS